ncbi:MAG TPA: stage II sporulation protein P [Candidatus Butyricicoccus stercorigallinarum]|nr:stage II sporulation protein P [Candidatus Butyricicoccus stercorigallinarum]
MAQKRKKRNNRGVPLWCMPCLLTAGALLAADRLGGAALSSALSQLAGNAAFVQAALASEIGALGWQSVSAHEPGAVSIAEVVDAQPLPEALTGADAPYDTDAESALVYESLFVPPANVQQAAESADTPTQTADGAPIKPLTITGESGGYPGQDGVYIQNASGLSYDLAAMLADPVKIQKNDSASEPTVLILHTHASEAYVDQAGARSDDPAHNVVHIGDVLTEVLEAAGIGVVHCRTIIDAPSYNQSYNRAMDIIEQQLEQTPSIRMVIDLHRDSMITSSGTEYKVVSEIDGQTCAQLMFVMGTNAGGLSHPNWKQNLNFAVNLQKSLLADYPTLMRPINLRKQRFNEQATTGSMILECGTSANTMQEAERAIRAFGGVLARELS